MRCIILGMEYSSATRRHSQLLRVSSPQKKSEMELYKKSPFAVDFNTTGWPAGLRSMSGIRLVPRSPFASLLKSALSAWMAHNKLKSSINFLHDSTLFAFSKVCNEFKASFDLEYSWSDQGSDLVWTSRFSDCTCCLVRPQYQLLNQTWR